MCCPTLVKPDLPAEASVNMNRGSREPKETAHCHPLHYPFEDSFHRYILPSYLLHLPNTYGTIITSKTNDYLSLKQQQNKISCPFIYLYPPANIVNGIFVCALQIKSSVVSSLKNAQPTHTINLDINLCIKI